MLKKIKDKGFTLVELLVVISIIALLLSVLMPSLGKAKEQARKVVCGSNFKQIYMSLFMYASENNGASVPYRPPNNTGRSENTWDSKIAAYFSTKKNDTLKKYLVCPSDSKKREETVLQGAQVQRTIPRSYMPNGALQNYNGFTGMSLIWTDYSCKAVKLSNVYLPAKTIYMLECFIGSNDENYTWSGRVGSEGNIQGSYNWEYSYYAPNVKNYLNAMNKVAGNGDQHKDGANWLFIDGRIIYSKYEKVESDKLYWIYGTGIEYPFSWMTSKETRDGAEQMGYKHKD